MSQINLDVVCRCVQGIAIECKRFETTSFGKRVEGFEIKLLFDPKSPEILSCHGWDSVCEKVEDIKIGDIVAIYNAPVQSQRNVEYDKWRGTLDFVAKCERNTQIANLGHHREFRHTGSLDLTGCNFSTI